MYERQVGRHYPWILLASGLAVGLGVLWLLPDMNLYRGLSGVDSGQFAAVVCVEGRLAMSRRGRWLFVGPAAAILARPELNEEQDKTSLRLNFARLHPSRAAAARFAGGAVLVRRGSRSRASQTATSRSRWSSSSSTRPQSSVVVPSTP